MRIFYFVALCFALCNVVPEHSVADEDSIPDSAATVNFDFVHHCEIGDCAFRFETTTLGGIIHALGGGVIAENGKDAGEGEFYVDFQDGTNLIRFSSNAEMGGKDHLLGEIEIRPLSIDEKRAVIPYLRSPEIFQFGSVGESYSRLKALLGTAEINDGVAWYRCSGKKSIKDSSGKILEYDVSGALRLHIVEGKVVALHVWQVTSS